MFDPTQIERAVAISRDAYQLLKWAETGIDRGFLHKEALEDYTSTAAITRAWMERHWADLPDSARRNREDLIATANFFSTYLDSSHIIEADPAARVDTHGWCGCFCPLCVAFVSLPHIQPLKLTAGDKKVATRLERRALELLAQECSAADEQVEAILADDAAREDRALIAYGRELLLRIEGDTSGPANLALWRRFAWKREGSPKKGFEFSAQMVLDAESRLRERLHTGPT